MVKSSIIGIGILVSRWHNSKWTSHSITESPLPLGWQIMFEQKHIDGRLMMVAKYKDPSGRVHYRNDNGYTNGLLKLFQAGERSYITASPAAEANRGTYVKRVDGQLPNNVPQKIEPTYFKPPPKKYLKLSQIIPLKERPYFMKLNLAQKRIKHLESRKKLSRHLFCGKSTDQRRIMFKTKMLQFESDYNSIE